MQPWMLQVKATDPGLQKLVYGAFGLPFGLALITICGGELFTANAAMMPAALYEVGWLTQNTSLLNNS